MAAQPNTQSAGAMAHPLHRLLEQHKATPSKPATHVSMMGGKFHFADSQEQDFLMWYADALASKVPCWLVEQFKGSPVFRLFVDLDLEEEGEVDDAGIVGYACAVQAALASCFPERRGEAGFLDCLVCTTNSKRLSNGNVKTGVHLIWPNVYADAAMAHAVRAAVVQELASQCAPRVPPAQNTWAEVVDASVYPRPSGGGGSALRMIGSRKAKDRVDEGRPYMPLCVLDVAGTLLPDRLELYQSNMLQLVMDTKIRTPEGTAPSSGFQLPEGITVEEQRDTSGRQRRKRGAAGPASSSESSRHVRPRAEAPDHPIGDDQRAALQEAVRQVAEYKAVTVTDAKRQGQCYTFHVKGRNARYCGHVQREHRGNRPYFMLTRKGLQQWCHDTSDCHGYHGPMVPLPLELEAVLFPPTDELATLTRILHLVSADPTDSREFIRAASAYLAGAYRLDLVEQARTHLEARATELGLDMDAVDAGTTVEPEATLMSVAYRATAADAEGRAALEQLEEERDAHATGGRSANDCVAAQLACTAPDGWKEYPECEEYLRPFTVAHGRTLAILSPMGSGKSKQVIVNVRAATRHAQAAIRRAKAACQLGLPVVWVSPRIAYTQDLQQLLRKSGCDVLLYSDDRQPSEDLLQRGKVTIISPQSLHLLRLGVLRGRRKDSHCALVVLDESESTLQQMAPNLTHRDMLMDNWEELLAIVRQADSVIAADAYLTNRTLNFLRATRPDSAGVLIRNTYKPNRGKARKIVGACADDAYAEWVRQLLECIEGGERLYVVLSSKERNNELAEKLRAMGVEVLQHTGEQRNTEELRDVNTHWAPPVQVVIVTCAVTVGVSYDAKAVDEGAFDRVFLWADAHCGLARDHMQSVARVRHVRQSYPALVYGISTSWGAETVAADVTARHDLRQQLRRSADPRWWREAEPVIREVDVANEAEAATSAAFMGHFLDHLLRISGYEIEAHPAPPLPPPQQEVKAEKVAAAAVPAYDAIATISRRQEEALEQQRRDGRTPLTAEQRWQMVKRTLVEYTQGGPDLEEQRREQWAKVADGRTIALDARFWHLLAERRGPKEVKWRAASRRFAHQPDRTEDQLRWVAPLVQKLGMTTSVDNGVVVDTATIADVTRWLAQEEGNIVELLKIEPTTREERDAVWARWMAQKLLEQWSGTKLKAVRKGRAKVVTWKVEAPLQGVGKLVGLVGGATTSTDGGAAGGSAATPEDDDEEE